VLLRVIAKFNQKLMAINDGRKVKFSVKGTFTNFTSKYQFDQ